ncbi:hypothetical protein [Pyxidicoccus trucidator]|uniref:hypothetical protein n=1 Tax=Pyxidicoccus trucidator TaxID=2709662 RepID=UPI0013D98CF9|nr:hypothetical protein [Pyxidicoccus trucidator]
MAEKATVKLDEQELLTFVMRCFEWRNADVFAFGRRDRILRLGEIAGYISMMGERDGTPRADSIRLILPPSGARSRQRMLDDVHEGVRRAYRRFEPDDARTAHFVEKTIAKVEVEQAADFTFASLDALLGRAKDRQAVIVGEASHYQSLDVVPPNEGPRLPEDDWCMHLHSVMLMAEARARASGSYIILDIGQYFPLRESNLELLKSAGDVRLCGASKIDELTLEEMLAKMSAAYDAATAGDIGSAVSLIESDDELSDRRKWILRLVVLERAGIRDEVSRTLDASAEFIATLKNEELLGIAKIAADVDRDDFAQDLVERALPELVAANDLENALQIALDTRRQALIQTVREQLRNLYPHSHLLRSVDGRAAAREGDYAKAANLLGGSPDRGERTVGDVFRLLADAIAGPGFDEPVKLGRELAGKMPDWKADIQRELMLSLERSGRRAEAVEMLFSGDVAWDEQWFVFARGLLGRSLASGRGTVWLEATSRLIDVAAAYIAENPAAGFARTSVADLLDADHVGIGGIAVMVMHALGRADRLPEIEMGDGAEGNRLDDIEQLPVIMERVLNWLDKKGNGVIVTGRDAIPSDVLGEDSDAVLHGILRMVNYHAPDPNDPDEEQLMKSFVTVALAVAPSAADPDGDLPVARVAAVKMLFGGRPQLARDLAEQILVVAGDRPARRRRALAAFADIYARVGRLREALLALIAAFELPSDGTWREAWDEQGVLLRILRDVGMAEESIRIVERLRKSLAKVLNGEVYGSRLDILELHAQLRRHQTRREDAWTTAQLLAAASKNAEAVLVSGDEALPGAVMLRQLIDQAEGDGTEVPAAAREMLNRLTGRLADPHRVLVAAAGRLPDAALVASVAGPIESARYNDDVSYDLRLARTMASRLARASTNAGDSEGFAYSLELLGAQGVGVHGAGAEVRAAERILADVKAPLAVATEIARLGAAVVGMALDGTGLMMMTVTAEGVQPPVAVTTDTFDSKLLVDWSRTYPYGYSNPKLPPDAFRDATRGVGLPDMPERAIVLSGDLSLVPPNVLTVGSELAGLSRSLVTVPSLSWLKASIAAARKGDGSAAAWIPVAAGGSYMDTLSLMAGELEEVLDSAKIDLHTQSATPVALASADLAIVGAHGGLAEHNRYFRGLSDDQHQPTDLRQLIDALRGSRIAVLLVCSGGRLDQHPESGGLVGIAHRLLDKGLDAVIAPSWPIPFTMARPWLDAFLKTWNAGCQVIDACRAGNDAVATATSTDLSRSLAMSLYGNPFIAR